MADKSVILELGSDVQPFVNGLNQATQKMSGFADNVSSSVGKLGNGFKMLGKLAVGAFAVGKIKNFAVNAVQASQEFERSINKIDTIARGVSMDVLRKDMLDTSRTMGIASADISNAVYEAVSSGIEASEAVGFVADANKLALAGFTTSASAVDVLTTTINSYGMQASDALHISDLLLKTQDKGKVVVDELAQVYGKLIPIASAVSVDMEQVSASMALLTRNGIPATYATTYLRSMFSELGKTGSKADNVLKQIAGKSFKQLTEEGMSVGEVLSMMQDHADATGTNLRDMFGRIEAGTGALVLAKANGEEYAEMLAYMREEGNLTEESFQKMERGLGRTLDRMKNQAELTSIAFGDVLAPFVYAFSKVAMPVMRLAEIGFQALGEKVDGVFQRIGKAIATSNIGQELTILKQRLSEKFESDGLAGAFDVFVEQIPRFKQLGIDMLRNIAEGIQENMPMIIDTAIQLFETWVTGFTQTFPQLVEIGMNLLLSIIQGIKENTPLIIEAITFMAQMFLDTIATMLPVFFEIGLQVLQGLIEGIVVALPLIGQTIVQLIQMLGVFIQENLPLIIEKGTQLIQMLAEGLAQALPILIEQLGNILTAIVQFLADNGADIAIAGFRLLLELVKGIIRALPDIIKAIRKVILKLISTIIKNFPKILETGAKILLELVAGILSVLFEIAMAVGEIFTTMVGEVSNIDWASLGKSIIDGIVAGIKGAGKFLLNAIGGVAESALSFAKEKLGINSPSKEFRDEVGTFIPEGIAVGIERTANVVYKAVGGLADDTLDTTVRAMDLRKARAVTLPTLEASVASAGTVITNTFHIQATIREEADMKKMAEAIQKEQDRHARAGGRVIYGIQV